MGADPTAEGIDGSRAGGPVGLDGDMPTDSGSMIERRSPMLRGNGVLDVTAAPIVGGLFGGVAGAGFAAITTDWIKQLLAVVSRQADPVLITAPLLGITLSVVILQVLGRGEATQHLDTAPAAERVRFRPWRSFPLDLARADLTADVVAAAGREETFPWRLAPIRTFAIVSSVGMGAPLGTESPAAHLGTAAGAALGSRRWARPIARHAGLGGGSAAIAALMGLPLVGMIFVLELGRRRNVPVTLERVLAAGSGAVVGWLLNEALELDFIRLAVPRVAPSGLGQMIVVALVVGATSGSIAAATGVAIYAARGWKASPGIKLLLGGGALALVAVSLLAIGGPSAAIGPGGGAVVWADGASVRGWTLMTVALLRAAATTSAIAAGGCGGVFVPFLAIGDLTGRAFVPIIGSPTDLAGAAGSAGGIAGGYRLPLTAVAMSVGVGGPISSTVTCVATAVIAAATGVSAAAAADRLAHRITDRHPGPGGSTEPSTAGR